MAAQTLDQVLSSLQSVYQPQLDSIAKQQADLPGQFQAQSQGLDATKDQAFGSILNGARARGTGVAFGGIPLGEQAQYTASTYLPAKANLLTSQNNANQSLIDAINKINEAKFNTGNNIYQFGVQSDLAQQQLDYQKQKDAEDRAAALRASAASAAAQFNPTIGGGGGAAPTPTAKAADPNTAKNLTGGKSLQDAYGAVQSLLGTKNSSVISQTLKAIQQSANYGNTYDQAKIKAINSIPEFKQYLAVINNPTF